jgi:hypothetical protein
MSSMQQPPVAPEPGSSSYPPPREPNLSARTLVAVIGVVFVILIGIVLVLLLMSGGGGSNSPKGALTGYADGFNDGNMEKALDHTLLAFFPNYDSIVATFDNIPIEDMINIEYSNLEVIYEDTMTEDQLQEVQYTLEEINWTLDIQIEETAIVGYTISLEYIGFPPATFDGEMVVVKVDGSWYLAMLDAPDLFDY